MTNSPADKSASIKKTFKSVLTSRLTISLVIGLVLGIGLGFFGTRALDYGWLQSSNKVLPAVELSKVRSILEANYDGDIDPAKQSEGAIRGLVASLGDPYTTYLDQREANELSSDLKGELSGIGIEVGIKNNRLTVVAPIDDTPADKAGLRTGDIIALIDGQDSSELTLDEAVRKIRGEKGTKVKLTIVRASEKPREIEIVRENIQVASIKTEIKDGNIGYIRIRRFGDDTDSLIRTTAADLAAKGVKKVVLDLRDNPGGYLDSAVTVSSEFLQSGTVVEERSRHEANKVLTANPGGSLTKATLVVLINQGSASASEITAGALHDNKRAILVGEKSYGKGSVQQVIKLDGGGQLKVTVAHWYTPNGVNISKEGIAPDVEVKLTTDDYNAGRDPQLDKALEILRTP